MSSIIPLLADMFPDTLAVQGGSTDGFGAWIPSGAVSNVPCYAMGGPYLVRDFTGREVVSTVRAVTAGAFDLTTHQHRYTLPARFTPRVDLQPLRVDKVSDEDGAHHEVVYFP